MAAAATWTFSNTWSVAAPLFAAEASGVHALYKVQVPPVLVSSAKLQSASESQTATHFAYPI